MDLISRTYFETIAFPSGNLSVVALVAGDVNYRMQANYRPEINVIIAFGMVFAIANLIWGCYIYRLMRKQMSGKKYIRNIASTCIEVEIVLGFLRICKFQ